MKDTGTNAQQRRPHTLPRKRWRQDRQKNKEREAGAIAKKETAVSNEEIIAALMNSSTLAQAAQAAGISSRALYDRMTDHDFRAEYQAARAAVLREAVTNLNNRIGAAVDTIAGIMEDTEANPAIRLQAAQTILNTSAKFSERLDKADAAATSARFDVWDLFK